MGLDASSGAMGAEVLTGAGSTEGTGFGGVKALGGDVTITTSGGKGPHLSGVLLQQGDQLPLSVDTVTYDSGSGVLICYRSEHHKT